MQVQPRRSLIVRPGASRSRYHGFPLGVSLTDRQRSRPYTALDYAAGAPLLPGRAETDGWDSMPDDSTTVGSLRAAMRQFVAARDWEGFHSPKNLAMSIAIEAAELMEHFQWYTPEESAARLQEPHIRAAVADEIADVLLYCLSLANATGIDLADAVVAKLDRNEGRFPVESVRGRLG